MIFGFVHNREAIVQLAVIGDQQKKQGIRAVIDTGFTGSLTLPLTMIADLELTWFTQQEGFLGDGSRRTCGNSADHVVAGSPLGARFNNPNAHRPSRAYLLMLKAFCGG
jgi:hypothetical protein